MSGDDNISVDKKFRDERDKLLFLIDEVEADDAPYLKKNVVAEDDVDASKETSSPQPSRARCMKRRSIWGDQILETAPDENNKPVNVFDSVQDPVLEQLTTDLTSQILRQQVELEALQSRLKSAESQLKTSSAWKNTTTSYCNLLLNELGSDAIDRNVLSSLCSCLSEHIGARLIAVGGMTNTDKDNQSCEQIGSEYDNRTNPTADDVNKLPFKTLFTITSGDVEDVLFHVFEVFTTRLEVKPVVDEVDSSQLSTIERISSERKKMNQNREEMDAARDSAALLSRKSFYLLCFALNIYSSR